MKYNVHDIYGLRKFTAEIDCDECTPESEKLRLAILWRLKESKDMRYANMRYANMWLASMRDVDMTGADMRYANMRRTDMQGANMTGANMQYTDMRDANMTGANMRDANMTGANMVGANMQHYPVGISGVGEFRRSGYAVLQDDKIMVRLCCFWDEETKAYEAIRNKYGVDSTYEALVRAACNQVRHNESLKDEILSRDTLNWNLLHGFDPRR